ncbi:TetR/AcrR family transcriptional regulator [Fodinicola acaciae]|uniref:TetR/AcrR family transcriptional regulator n=1 Tax=Fodinicola acaciae TaxID=2681555 RepID=UPI001C9E7A6C|nr:TetR/AcrR family transcriptional regulator [Fodinicola acaciae]
MPAEVTEGMSEPRTTRRRAETRRKLIAVAYEVFTEHGIRDAPVELICERAGFTRGAFYSNFGSKEELFLAVYQEQMQAQLSRLRDTVDAVLEESAPHDHETLRTAIARVVQLFMTPLIPDTQWYLANIEFRVQALRQPELRAQTDTAQEFFHAGLAEILEATLERVGMSLIVDPHDAVHVLVSMCETAMERAVFEEHPSPLENRIVTDVLPKVLAALIQPA